jgi:mannose-6-phosphate isomerase-like protein (cupin superfamily)
MSGYTVKRLEEISDVFGGNYPGEMRLATSEIDAEQAAFSYRRMPQHTGGKGSYGHRHRIQEEIYFVMSGKVQFKLDDEVLEVGEGTIVRVAPETARSVWNDEPEDAELVICAAKVDDPSGDVERVPDFWPE